MTVEEKELILGDDSISSSDEDWFNFTPHAHNLVDDLIRIGNNSSICCGVIGDWGSGKSSFLKLMADYIRDEYAENIIISWFIAWDPNGFPIIGDAILYHIYNEVVEYASENPSEHTSRLQQQFEKFSDILGIRRTFRSSVQNFFRGITKLESSPGIVKDLATLGEHTISELQSSTIIRDCLYSLNEYLEFESKSIFFFIDEIDRASGIQIYNILSELKAYLSLDNIIIILGYDENYVVESLQKNLPEGIDANEYIDKIITIRKNIPLPEYPSLINMTERYLSEYDQLTEHLESLSEFASNLCGWNPRRLKRILLSFIQHIPEVDLGYRNVISLLILTALDETGLLKYRDIEIAIINDDTELLLNNLSTIPDLKLRDEAKSISDAIETLESHSRFSTSVVRNLGMPVFRPIIRSSRERSRESRMFPWKVKIFNLLPIIFKKINDIPGDFFYDNEKLDIRNIIISEIDYTLPIFRFSQKSGLLRFESDDIILFIIFTELIDTRRLHRNISTIITRSPYLVENKPVHLWVIDDGAVYLPEYIQRHQTQITGILPGLKNPIILHITINEKINELIEFLYSKI